jgi:hypothetical protein
VGQIGESANVGPGCVVEFGQSGTGQVEREQIAMGQRSALKCRIEILFGAS